MILELINKIMPTTAFIKIIYLLLIVADVTANLQTFPQFVETGTLFQIKARLDSSDFQEWPACMERRLSQSRSLLIKAPLHIILPSPWKA